LSVAELLAETIRRISKEDSVSSLFIDWGKLPQFYPDDLVADCPFTGV